MTFTNLSQTERLRKLGLLPTTYDVKFDGVWTLGDLLDLIPKYLEDVEMKYEYPIINSDMEWKIAESDEPQISGGYLQIEIEEGRWYIDYGHKGFSGRYPNSESLIEALVLAIELLAANGYDFKPKKKSK